VRRAWQRESRCARGALCDDRPVQVEKLADIDFFSALSKRELQQIASWTDELVVPAGDDLVPQRARPSFARAIERLNSFSSLAEASACSRRARDHAVVA
jgi:hypothetical protein